jgi:hypothetical protein
MQYDSRSVGDAKAFYAESLAAHEEATRATREREEKLRERCSTPIRQYIRGLLTLSELTEIFIDEMNRVNCDAGTHEYFAARVGTNVTDWCQCIHCEVLARVEPVTLVANCTHVSVFAGSTNDPVLCPACMTLVPVTEL